jgi:beta-mannosidase
MEQHQKNASGNGLIIAQMTDNFRLPKDFPSLVYLSMVLQSEGIRYGVEHWRRHKERVAGTLYWQLNDCWPVASWASLDYFGRWKALHYAARRFYAPLMLSVDDRGLAEGLYVTSDLGESWEGEIRWSLETLEGKALVSGVEQVTVPPYASVCVQTIDLTGQVSEEQQRELIFVGELWQEEQRLGWQVVTFVPTKHVSLADPEITVTPGSEGGQMTIELTSRSLARLVELSLDGADVIFSDNYFDLPAGRSIAVSCPLPDGWTQEQAAAALKVRSVYDSYAHSFEE